MNFTKEERYIIAEYIYSYNSDILIKSDALQLIDVLDKKGIIEHILLLKNLVKGGDANIADKLMDILINNIPDSVLNEIMHEYLN